MSCVIADERVCLGRDDIDGCCVFCLRQQARDRFRSGLITFDEFRLVLATTNEAMR